MWGYIFGISLGTLFMIFMFGVFFIFLLKNMQHNKMLKKIVQNSETNINNDIKTWATQTKNFFISSPLFKYQQNKIFKVDSILITPQGLFVIDIKSIKGEVNGDAHLSYWTKNQDHKIINPIIHNEKNIDNIMQMIKFKIPTISLIIFSNKIDVLNIQNIPDHVLVFKHSKLFETLDNLKTLKISLSEYETKTIYSILKSFITNKNKDKNFFNKLNKR